MFITNAKITKKFRHRRVGIFLTTFIGNRASLEQTSSSNLSANEGVSNQAQCQYTNDDGGFNKGGTNRTGTMISAPPKNQAYVGTNVEYSQHVEYGTRNMRSQPYLRPAIDLLRKKIVAKLRQLIAEKIRGRT